MDTLGHFRDLPRLGIGTYEFSGTALALRQAVRDEPRLIDTSPLYGTEAVVGEAARGVREKFFIATKVFPDCYRPADLRHSVRESLQRLQTDYIDLLQLHWPADSVPIEETVGAMSDLVDEGIVRQLGVCNFRMTELRAAVAVAKRHPIVSNQIPYSLYDRRYESDVVPFCRDKGITVIAYSPLGGMGPGFLAERDKRRALARVAVAHGATVSQVALSWVIRKPNTMAIPRTSSTDHMAENWLAEQLTLTEPEIAILESSVRPRRERMETEERIRRAIRRRLYTSSGELSGLGRLIHSARDSARALKGRLA
jgi:diketogulonate reductase-like aldo/keto reductase